jgi:hypothetical protein
VTVCGKRTKRTESARRDKEDGDDDEERAKKKQKREEEKEKKKPVEAINASNAMKRINLKVGTNCTIPLNFFPNLFCYFKKTYLIKTNHAHSDFKIKKIRRPLKSIDPISEAWFLYIEFHF